MELIGLHIDGEATVEQERMLSEHLAGCASCRALLEAYEQIDCGVAALEAEPPERFVSGVMYRVSQEDGGTKKHRFVHRHAAALVGVAAALAVLVGTGTLPLPHAEDAVEYETADVLNADMAKVAAQPDGEACEEEAETEQSAAGESQMLMDGYDAIFDAVVDESATEATEAAESMILADDALAETAGTEGAETIALHATISGCAGQELPELALLTPDGSAPDTYRGTVAQVRQIIERYAGQYDITSETRGGAADDDVAILVIVP